MKKITYVAFLTGLLLLSFNSFSNNYYSDNNPLPIANANCQNHTVYLDASGNASIIAADIDNGSVGDGFSIDISSFTCANIGTPVIVTLTVTDSSDSSSDSCTAQVTVLDNINPIPSLGSLPNITAECSVTSLTDPTATDNCGGSVTVTHNASLPISSQGTTVVTWTYDDGNGNTTTQNQNVIIDDVTPPITPIISTRTRQCSTIVPTPTTTDNCTGGIISGTTSDPTTYSTQGTYTITWNFDDGNGNSINVDQDIIIDDVTDPTPSLGSLPNITAECSVTSLTDPTATDNCGGSVTVSHNASLPITAQGTTVVIWTYDDGNGNTTTQNQNVIIDDVTDPTPSLGSLPNITAECSVGSLTAPTATDNCGGSVTVSHNASLPITSQGTTVVIWTYDDGNGNTTTQNQNVIINDVTDPTPSLGSLPNITAECSVGSLTAPTATDNCGGSVTVSHNASLPITAQGTTVVIWTYDDGNGNITTQNQNVIIDDVTDPTPSLGSLADITAECSVGSLTAPTATDNCGGSVTVSHNASLPITAQGTTVVIWTYDDGNGNTTTQNQNVIINDVTDPTPSLGSLPNITAECSVGSLTAPTATDNCGGSVTVSHNASLPITSQGTTVVIWTYDDGNGNTTTQNQNVIIDDVTDPTPSLGSLADITAECSVGSLTAPTATDNCGGSVAVSHNATLPITAQGTTVVIWTYDDGNGNTTTQNQNVIIDDVTDPTPSLGSLPNITAECSVTSLTAPTATDNCGGSVTVSHNASLPITAQGTTVVIWTYDDGNGNTTTQNQNVIIDDVTDPTPSLGSLPNITAECSVTSLTAPTATDNCGGSVTVSHNASLPITAQGTTVVIWTYDDGNGNTTTQNQNVIIDDVTDPTPSLGSLPNITAECSVTSLTAPTATDNCGGSVTVSHNATLPITAQGTTVVIWTYDDGNGNTTTQNQNVIINDVTDPTPSLGSLANITAECSVTSLTAPTATDNCGGSVTVSHNATLPITAQGTTVVIWTYDDGNGNTTTQNQNVIINDVTDPTPSLGSLANITAECSVTSLTAPTATDNCGGSVTVSHNATLPITAQGTTVVIWTYDDGNGNTTTQNQNVIIDDITDPTPSLGSLADITAECSVTSLTAPTATDNCGGSVTVSHNATLPITAQGTTVVIWTYDDGNGNTTTQNQNVIINDVTDPTPSLGSLANITAECSVGSLTAPTATDNCGGSVTVSHNATLPITAQGTTVVIWTYDDGNGNTTTQNQNVIINDVTDPTPSLGSLANITAECSVGSLTAPTATDNCGGSVTVSHNATLPITAQGTTVVIWTYDDGNGNTTTQNQNVIIDDVTAPIAPTLATITGQCSATAPTPTTTDGCNGGTITGTTSDPLTYNTQGAHIITWNFDDGNGNSVNVDQTVFINDTIDPVAICQNITVPLNNATGTATITASQINNGSTDNCGIGNLTYTLSQSTFDCTNIGPNIITLTVQDAGGNTDTCTATVTVTSPNINGGNLIGYLTNTETPADADDIIEVTACPDEPQNAILTLSGYMGTIVRWESSINGGVTWTNISNTTNTYTLNNILQTTLLRVVIQIGSCQAFSNLVYVVVVPPDVPPTIIGPSEFDMCLGDAVTVEAESAYGVNSAFNNGGMFNEANLNNLGWIVDGAAEMSAGGNNTNDTYWKETNGPKKFNGRCYDSTDNTKFAIVSGTSIYDAPDHTIAPLSTLETPIFNTLGLTSAHLEFDQAYYLEAGAWVKVELSVDSGSTYSIELDPGAAYDYTGPSDSGFLASVPGFTGQCRNNLGTLVNKHVSIDLQSYIGMTGLRIKFTYSGTNNSAWALDNITIPDAPIDETIEWTDENGVVVTTGATTTVTPITPGIQTYGVTSLINGCRSEGDEGTEFIQVSASLAYAGENIVPIAGECGESTVQLKAYDNTLTALQNFANGAWDTNYHLPVLANGDTDYPGTGENGFWSVTSAPSACGSTYGFSDINSPSSTFSGEAGTYTLTWTVAGCTSSVDVTLDNCDSVDFDGVNDHVLFDDNYDMSGEFSIEVWVKPESISGQQTILSKRNANNLTTGYDISLNGGRLSFNWNNSGSINSAPYNLTTNRWYHIGVVLNSGTYSLYIDGVLIKTVAGSVPSSNNMKCILGAMDQAGNPPNKPVNYFNGWMDELRFWNKPISANQLRQMMNQEIRNNTAVAGEVLPLDIPGLTWVNLEGYYRMQVACGKLTPYAGTVTGKLRNIYTPQQETAPIPYTSRVDGQQWTTDNTWTHWQVWDVPNSIGIDNSTPIDWNIVQVSHNIDSGNKDLTVLGLISDTANKELTISDPGSPQDETNTGKMLWITHYLDLDGKIDLVGESQLIQKRYNASQVNGSIFNNTSLGYIERDQQGTSNPFNYNYWSSPVAQNNAAADNSNSYSLGSILRDGTTTVNNPISRNINWTAANTASASNPAQVSTRWLYAYINNPAQDYYSWEYIGNNVSIPIGLGYTMKGSGNATANQNYVYVGKPNNGTISTAIGATRQSLVGNPYPSAIDSREFIIDNGPSGANSITGTLYFWEHYTSNATHITELYEGGYAALNFTGGVGAVQHPDLIISNNGTKIPERYIPVGQGFFVEAGSSTGQVTFNNSQRIFKTEAFTADTYEGSVFIRNSAENSNSEEITIKRIRLEFTSPEGARRPLLLGFVPDGLATDAVDWAYDGKNNDESANSDLSWIIEDEKYVIQGVGEFDANKQYPLGLFLTANGNIKISLTDLENFDTTIDVFIYDSLLGTYTQINDTDFDFEMDAGEYMNRFFLTFQSESLTINENEISDQLLVNYLNNSDEIYINVPNSISVKQVFLIQMLGQTVNTWEITNAHAYLSLPEIRIPVKGITDGTYIIKIVTENNQTINKKVIITQ